MEVINDSGLVAAGSDEGQILVFDSRIHGKKSSTGRIDPRHRVALLILEKRVSVSGP